MNLPVAARLDTTGSDVNDLRTDLLFAKDRVDSGGSRGSGMRSPDLRVEKTYLLPNPKKLPARLNALADGGRHRSAEPERGNEVENRSEERRVGKECRL